MTERDDAAYIDHLESEVATLQAQNKQLEDEVKRLKKEKGLSSARDGLTFNKRTGIWTDASQTDYCPKCLDKDKRNPLRIEDDGWRCTACDEYYYNPDAPPPPGFIVPRGY
jgi:rubredoxin